jgi:hypothetical protein
MTDLQASLIGIGGAIVAGVISYNKWQEYKARKTMERAFSSSHDDVLMGSAAWPCRRRPAPRTGLRPAQRRSGRSGFVECGGRA